MKQLHGENICFLGVSGLKGVALPIGNKTDAECDAVGWITILLTGTMLWFQFLAVLRQQA